MTSGRRNTIPFGPFSRASSAASGSSSFSEVSVWVLACPLTDIVSLGTVAFTFDDVGEEAPATATSCCFCKAAYKWRKSEDTLTREANETFALECILTPRFFVLPKHSALRNY